MKRTTFWLLSLLVFVLPVWVLGAWLGLTPRVAETAFANLGVGTLFVIVPVIAAGILTIAALRSVDQDASLSDAEKRKWRDSIFFGSFVAAMLYFHRRFEAESRPAAHPDH